MSNYDQTSSISIDANEHLQERWYEDTIRIPAFCEVSMFEKVPRVSNDDSPVLGEQLELPRTPTMFAVECFSIDPFVGFTN